MRILHIGKYYPPYFGGIEKVNYDLVESLNNNGYSTDVLCFNNEHKTVFENNRYNIYRASILTSSFSSPLSFSIFKILRKIYRNYDIIHLHVPNPMGAVALQSINFKGKIVVHWHSDIIKQQTLKKLYRPFQTRLLRRADKIIVTSPNYLEGSSDLATYKEKCVLIPIGISKDEFIDNPTFRNELETRYKNKKIVFSLGRLIYYKGFEYLIEAAKNLPEDYLVLIGGTGTLKEKLSAKIIENGLEAKVKLLGKIPFDQIGEYYKRADLFCMPSTERSEAFGVVQIEAMAFGCPVVSTNIIGSGVPWVNMNNFSGIVVEPKNPSALSTAILEICNIKEKRSLFSLNAISHYKNNFTKELMVRKTIDLYQGLFV